MIRVLVLLALVGAGLSAEAQQMVILKKGQIIHRYNLGDEIRFVLKDDPKQDHHAAILSIQEFSFVTLQKDTIEFSQVSRVKFKNKGLKKYVTSTLIASGSLLALHFALKGPFGDTNPQAVNGLAYAASAGLIPIAFAVLFNRSKIKLNGFKRLKFINYDSPLYK